MANIVYNISLGRVIELHLRARSEANRRLVVIPLNLGTATDATLKDQDNLTQILNAGATQAYTAISISGGSLPAPTVDDANDRASVTLPDLTWAAVPTGTAWHRLLICYDPDAAGGTNDEIVPMTHHDFNITPDGSDIIASFPNGYFLAQ